ncbi:MAG: HEAT repeat domain-containing protein [Opitutus sp.]|nr:HEAT repeat domain-containing protein [Opitutus sp.]
MNCQAARDTFPALLDHRAAAADHANARAHLAVCPDCQREFAALHETLVALDSLPAPLPSPQLKKSFYVLLETEKQMAASPLAAAEISRSAPPHRARRWRWLLSPILSSAMLLVGFIFGTRSNPSPSAGPSGADDATKRELADLRQQVNKMGQLVGYSLRQQQQGPANERLRSVLASANTAQPGDKVLDDLISALAFDPNANIRLRALEALYAHAENAVVRSGVIAALPREQNPLVQLEMIDFVATAHDGEATSVLEKMAENEAIDQSVRGAARRALTQL